MSAHDTTSQNAALPNEPESLPYMKLFVVAVVTLATFAVGVVWSTAILNKTVEEQHPKTAAEDEHIGDAPEIGIVNQHMFELDNRAAEKRHQQLTRLHSWGWIDKSNKVAHISIERAMEMMVAEQKK